MLLGLSVTTDDQIRRFYNRIQLVFNGLTITEESYEECCFSCGYAPEDHIGMFRYLPVLMGDNRREVIVNAFLFKSERNEFPTMLLRLSCLINAVQKCELYQPQKASWMLKGIQRCIDETRIKVEFITDEDGVFFIPSGVELFDKVLIKDAMEWLAECPICRETLSIAFKQYAERGENRNIVDNMRKAFEEFIREFLGNEKILKNNIDEVGKYLKEKDVNVEFRGMFTQLIHHYDTVNNLIAKHQNETTSNVVEYLNISNRCVHAVLNQNRAFL